MFTGIIEEVGTVHRFQKTGKRYDLEITASRIPNDLHIDDSVSVNGVCLTVVHVHDAGFLVQVIPQTIRMSALSELKKGDGVNLEWAMAAGDRFGGHFVQGHVDGVGNILSIHRESDHAEYDIEIPQDLAQYCIPQGSIAIDGISLTIASLEGNRVRVALIPHTLKQTNLGGHKSGDLVNIEVDLLSKYVEKHIHGRTEGKMSLEWLKEQGW